MDAFLINVSSFPTMIYSIGLVVVGGYWMLVLLGLFDFDVFDIDVDFDIDADGDISQVGSVAGLLTSIGLTGVPITVVISLLLLNSWFICYFASEFIPVFPQFIFLVQILIGLGIIVLSFLISIPITATMIKPLKGLFKKINQEPIAMSIIGRSCRVRSSRVDNDFGEAECFYNGASLIVKIRSCGDQKFATGDTVVLLKHNVEQDTYDVISEEEFKKELDKN